MNAVFQRLHDRLGDFWWYSLLMFVALRCGDLINAVVGLWLVPKYVPQEELGAVLPLTQFATTFGLPISILVLVFTKYLAQFKAKGEFGKVKSLLRWFLGFVMVASLLTVAVAKFTLPALFERIRIQDGSLSLLIIATGIVSTVAPVFNNALQGLKKFKTITFLNLVTAPVRLVSMLVLLPIRALSGYMAGQLVPSIVAIVTATLAIRKDIARSIKSVPFWKDDLCGILRYAFCVVVWVGIGSLTGLVMPTIVRQRLPEIESAAYYIISRFSELATYAGITLAFVMFPMTSEAETKGHRSYHLLFKMSGCSAAFGLVCAVVLYFAGDFIFTVIPPCRPYVAYARLLSLHAVVLTVGQVWTNYLMFEAASNRFRFLLYAHPIAIVEAAFLACFTGYTFFDGVLPCRVVVWMGGLHIASLKNIYLTCLCFGLIRLSCASLILVREMRLRKKGR